MAQAPVKRTVQIGNARGEGCADVVESSSRVVVRSFEKDHVSDWQDSKKRIQRKLT